MDPGVLAKMGPGCGSGFESRSGGGHVQLLEAPVSVHNTPYDADNWSYKLKLEDPGARAPGS